MERLLEALSSTGTDIEGNLTRFMGNEALYAKFLRKFADDPSYQSLEDAIGQKDDEGAFKSAHTLKGVAANLGLNQILEPAGIIVEEYRGGAPDTKKVKRAWQTLTEVYEQTCKIIKDNS